MALRDMGRIYRCTWGCQQHSTTSRGSLLSNTLDSQKDSGIAKATSNSYMFSLQRTTRLPFFFFFFLKRKKKRISLPLTCWRPECLQLNTKRTPLIYNFPSSTSNWPLVASQLGS
ncbi:putative Ester hydrolase C11orf54 like protein [Fusarium oxysporum f. sp. albedinis]|nr:putative Ester hydrolase C11orf54 like protein [Fusarium oxysporum f. sp. albedinis]